MQKLRYEVDPHNRLIVSETGEKSGLTRFRRVLDGRFKTGPGNTLIYHIKAPMEGLAPELTAPHQVKLQGKWSLTENHDLRLTLDKWRRQTFGDELTLQGELIRAEANALLFAVTTRTKEGLPSIYILKLEGVWQADKQNRLTFRVNKGEGGHDTLTLSGIWEINERHRIVYRYEQAQLLTKEKLKKTLEFKGCWDIAKRNRLSYALSLDGKSAFDFQTSLGLLNEDYIKYEVGIGAADKKQPVRRVITLFGKWRLKKNTGLLFEIDYEKGKTKAIVFGAEARLGKSDNLEFRLKNELGQDLDMKLKLSRRLIKGDGEAFLKLLKSKKESSIYVGAAWKW